MCAGAAGAKLTDDTLICNSRDSSSDALIATLKSQAFECEPLTLRLSAWTAPHSHLQYAGFELAPPFVLGAAQGATPPMWVFFCSGLLI